MTRALAPRDRTAKRRRNRLPRALLAGAFGIAAATGAAAEGAPADGPLTLYAGQHQQMVRGLVSAFEEQEGIEVRVRGGGGPQLANQIVKEGTYTPADVFFTENSPTLMNLENKGLLAPVAPETLDRIPARYNSQEGRWVGVVARQSVLTYNPEKIDGGELPTTLLELADPEFDGRIAVSPTEGDFLPIVRAMTVEHGREETVQWLEGLAKNARIYSGNIGVVTAVDNGSAALGVVNSYYYYRVRQQIGQDEMTARIAHFEDGSAGNLVTVSGAAVLAHAPNPEAGQKFLAFLVSEKTQRMLGESEIDFEYPLRPGIPANEQLEPLSQLRPPEITVDELGDNTEALDLLREAGLL